MPRVLQVNCVYGNGSTGKIIKTLHNGLICNGWDNYVCYSRGREQSDINILKLTSEWVVKLQSLASRITGYSYACSPFTTHRLKRQIQTIKPDIVNLHCINANTVNIAEIITYLKHQCIPTVVTAHAEFLYTGGCAHALDCEKWLSGCDKCVQFHSKNSQLPISYFFERNKNYWDALKTAYSGFENLRLTGVSPWLVSRIKCSPFFNPANVYCTPNGLDTDIFCKRESHLRNKFNISGQDRVYLHVTPNFNDPLKGGGYIVEFAKKMMNYRPKDRIIIIGVRDKCSELPSNIIPIAHTNNQTELAEYYSMADVTLLTSSRETFSMVTAESLCCGTPVVGFQAGGPESICTKGHTKFVPYNNLDDLIAASLTIEKTDNISSDYIPEFSVDAMVSNYENVYRSF